MLKLSMSISSNQSGVAILYILIAITLFAALGYVFMQSMSSTNPSQLTEEEARVYAQDVLSYANRLNRGVQRAMSKGTCSENDISFYLDSNDSLSAYEHTPEVDDTCKVFSESGGTITWLPAPPSVNDGSEWIFTGDNRIAELESDAPGTGNDLTAFLPNLDREVCIQINELLRITNPNNLPPVENDNVVYAEFIGSFNTSTYLQTSGDELNGQTEGCFEANQIDSVNADGTFHFYTVLIAR